MPGVCGGVGRGGHTHTAGWCALVLLIGSDGNTGCLCAGLFGFCIWLSKPNPPLQDPDAGTPLYLHMLGEIVLFCLLLWLLLMHTYTHTHIHRQVGIRSLEPVGVFLPGDQNYPGGTPFDPLGFSQQPDGFVQQAVKEIKNGRLAMVAMLGYFVQAAVTRQGPVENLLEFLRDPVHNNVFGYLFSSSSHS